VVLVDCDRDNLAQTAASIGSDVLTAVADVTLMQQCQDAVDATLARHAGTVPPPPVRVSLSHVGNRVLVDIADQGTGMSEAFVRDTLFRPFGTAKHGGTGIGAFQARELVREAGGDLVVTSRPGQGTTMRLVLPAAATRPQPALASEQAQA
jgi:signal transduction histidine kinase